MVRFIMLCMSVVALSFLSIGAQFLIGDMKDEEASIMARNEEDLSNNTELANSTDASQASILNNIDTAAGFDYSKDDVGFGESFTNVAPKALTDDNTESLPFVQSLDGDSNN